MFGYYITSLFWNQAYENRLIKIRLRLACVMFDYDNSLLYSSAPIFINISGDALAKNRHITSTDMFP
jgi:hypothetical protein